MKFKVLFGVVSLGVYLGFSPNAIASHNLAEPPITDGPAVVDRTGIGERKNLDPQIYFEKWKAENAALIKELSKFVPNINRVGNSTVTNSDALADIKLTAAVRTELWRLAMDRDTIAEMDRKGDKNLGVILKGLFNIDSTRLLLWWAESMKKHEKEIKDPVALSRAAAEDVARRFTAAEKKKTILYSPDLLKHVFDGVPENAAKVAEQWVDYMGATGTLNEDTFPLTDPTRKKYQVRSLEALLSNLRDSTFEKPVNTNLWEGFQTITTHLQKESTRAGVPVSELKAPELQEEIKFYNTIRSLERGVEAPPPPEIRPGAIEGEMAVGF